MISGLPHLWPVACHTDHVAPGGTFFALKGQHHNGVEYIPHALTRGASVVVVEQNETIPQSTLDMIISAGAVLRRVTDIRKELAVCAARAWGHPAKKLTVLGITGTKGKSTTAYLLEHILRANGVKTGLISTVENSIDGSVYPAPLTTPHADYLHMFLAQCVQRGVTHVVMEIAAQGLSLDRVYSIPLSVGMFTNFAKEHGEFYPTQDEYFAAKAKIVELLKPEAPLLLYAHDQQVMRLHKTNRPVYLFGKDALCASMISAVYPHKDTLICDMQLGSSRYSRVTIPHLLGEYNACNVAGAALAAMVAGIPAAAIIQSLHSFKGVPGRLERYELSHNRTVYIDYAHNPSSYAAVLSTLRPLTQDLRVVFGCGGARDKEKRPLMGYVACMYADWVYLTTDNPRNELPEDIVADILTGIPDDMKARVVVELDRARAITSACTHASPGAIIALLGIGPDRYMTIQGKRHPFNERDIVRSLEAL